MKQVKTWLNEEEFKLFVSRASKLDMTSYALTKELVMGFLGQNTFDEKTALYRQIEAAKKKQQWTILFVYGLTCYFIVSLVYILFF